MDALLNPVSYNNIEHIRKDLKKNKSTFSKKSYQHLVKKRQFTSNGSKEGSKRKFLSTNNLKPASTKHLGAVKTVLTKRNTGGMQVLQVCG